MMQGVVNLNCEATIPLVVSNENRQTQLIDAVILYSVLSPQPSAVPQIKGKGDPSSTRPSSPASPLQQRCYAAATTIQAI